MNGHASEAVLRASLKALGLDKEESNLEVWKAKCAPHEAGPTKAFGVVARAKAPPGYVGIWVNMYRHGRGRYARLQTGGAYCRREDADLIAKKHRADCTWVWVKKHD